MTMYEQIKKGNIDEACKAGISFVKNSTDIIGLIIEGDFVRLEFATNDYGEREEIYYKGKNLDEWEKELPIKKDSYTGFTYFEIEDYQIPTAKYRDNFDVEIAKVADKKGIYPAEVSMNSIFTKSKEKYISRYEFNCYGKSFSTITTNIPYEIEQYLTLGSDPFKRLLAFLYDHENRKAIKNGEMTEKDIKKELFSYMDFDLKLNKESLSTSEKEKLIEEEIFKIIDMHNDLMAKNIKEIEKIALNRKAIEDAKKDDMRNKELNKKINLSKIKELYL